MKKFLPISRSGRFRSGPASEVAQFTQSIQFDWRLWRHDIRGSRAHAAMLNKIGLLSAAELRSILDAFNAIEQDIVSGKFSWKPELEDVHMNIEAELTRRAPAGAKLHTGRSRNDQVALDMRLWLLEQIDQLLLEIRSLQLALVKLGQREKQVVLPGYTHLQRAQPVLFAHHLLAYVEMLARDFERLEQCRQRTNVCPLGSGALAGSTLPLDRAFVARQLGFVNGRGQPRLSRNSMDAVADRDFILEFCSHAALLAIHLSRLAEDMVLWASSEFNFIQISDAFTTGSSLMPQKRNPDVAELARGKSGRVIGNLVALLTLLKGLAMTYNRDLQEDKERLFDTVETVRSTVRICAAMFGQITVNRQACLRAAEDPALLATDLADFLVRKGVPFRTAHQAVGEAVAIAEQTGRKLNQLTLSELQSVQKQFTAEALKVFDLKKALGQRRLMGSPGNTQVAKQLAEWKRKLR